MNKQEMTWDLNFNMTHVKNEITKLPPAWNPVQGNYYRAVGNSMYDWYMPVWAGLTSEGQDSWYLYVFKKDADGNEIEVFSSLEMPTQIRHSIFELRNLGFNEIYNYFNDFLKKKKIEIYGNLGINK